MFQPHSGSQANMGAYRAILNPKDKVWDGLGSRRPFKPMDIDEFFRNRLRFLSVLCFKRNRNIDYDVLQQKVLEIQPKLIVAGASAYPRALDSTFP